MNADYYDTIGSILRDRLGTDADPFEQAVEGRQGRYRSAGNKIERRVPKQQTYKAPEPVRVPVPEALVEDFAVLQVLPGVPLEYCKQAWKHLLKKYHPDFITDKSRLPECSAIIRRINRSYKRIEAWFLTGKIRDDLSV
ncbi:MAG: J domain-containing protein [Treponema sp.]